MNLSDEEREFVAGQDDRGRGLWIVEGTAIAIMLARVVGRRPSEVFQELREVIAGVEGARPPLTPEQVRAMREKTRRQEMTRARGGAVLD